MSNLVPVQRVNKLGHTVTKHVRPDSSVLSGAATIPAPAITPRTEKLDPELAKRIRMLEGKKLQTIHRLSTKSSLSDKLSSYVKVAVHADEKLSPWFRDTYQFTCSDNSFYDLLERVRLDDAIVMKANSVQMTHFDKLIKKNKLEACLQDNSGLVAELRARGIVAMDYVQVAFAARSMNVSRAQILDAAECLSLYPEYEFAVIRGGPRGTYPELVLNGAVRLADIKDIGPKHCKTKHFEWIMKDLAAGKAACSASELGEMLDNPDASDGSKSDRIHCRVQVAVACGIETARKVSNPVLAQDALYPAMNDELSREQTIDFINYVEKTIAGVQQDYYFFEHAVAERYKLWRAGVPAGPAHQGLLADVPTDEIIAVQVHGVAASVANGWI